MEVEKYLDKFPDDKELNELTRNLRKLPEEERFQFIMKLLSHKSFCAHGVGQYLARACLERKEFLAAILELGLEVADASRIRWWLGAVVPKLGFPRATAILKSKLGTQPKQVDKALYWLPDYLPENSERSLKALQELRQAADEMGIIRKPKVVPNPDKPGHFLIYPLED